MGMYTEFRYVARLKDNLPPDVLRVLEVMLGDSGVDSLPAMPDHPLFQDVSAGRWQWMLRCSAPYFDAATHSVMWYDTAITQRFLNVQCSLKNYEEEIEKFVDWMAPYIDAVEGDFLGYSRYEEDREPTLIYHQGGE